MRTIVITGSTRGIGLGLAQEFLKRGCRVVVSGRSADSVDKALSTLKTAGYKADQLTGIACEVSDAAQVQALWDGAVQQFGSVDMWINNAGIDIASQPFWELPLSEIDRIFDINMMGVVYGSHVALRGMIKQGKGTLYNMEGFGSSGMKRAGMTSYGTTKYGLRYLTQSLQQEAKNSPVIVGTMSPGIVATDLLLDQYKERPQDWERAKRIFNILADKVETVTPYLAEQALQNTRKTPAIAWLTTPKIMLRFMTARFTGRKVFD